MRHDKLGWHLYDDKVVKSITDSEMLRLRKQAYYLVFKRDRLCNTSIEMRELLREKTIGNESDRGGTNYSMR